MIKHIHRRHAERKVRLLDRAAADLFKRHIFVCGVKADPQILIHIHLRIAAIRQR